MRERAVGEERCRFRNKATIVTGGGSGIGREAALEFAREGSRVVVVDIDRNKAEEVADQIGGEGGAALPLEADVCKGANAKGMVAATIKAYGRVDALVNCAGVLKRNSVFDISEEEWDSVIAVNVKGTFLCCQAVAAAMRRDCIKGKIVNVASVGAFVANPNLSHYHASKGAVVMFTRACALELAPLGINVNAVAPGPTQTPMIQDRLDNSETRQWTLDRIPLGRLGQPKDAVNAALFLASDDADYITGHVLVVDGGWMIH